MRLLLLLGVFIASGSISLAQSRYQHIGQTLIFDMTLEEQGYQNTKQLEMYDVKLIAEYLFNNPEIKTLRISGLGGFIPAARKIARVLIRYDIDTEAFDKCYSACTIIFLAGNHRVMSEGGQLGFHRQWIDKKEEKRHYEAMRVTTGWKDEFDYIAYVYNVLTDHIISDIEFMISRGVELDFVLKTFKTDTIDMWTPERKELFEAGVLSN